MFEQIMNNFCGVFGRMLKQVNNNDSSSLGDRSTYIGASDIGKCPRQAVLGKLEKTEHTPRELIRFLRGHVTETVVNKCLDMTGAFYTTQFEVVHPLFPFIIAHIDCIIHDRPTVEESGILIVKEMKSPGELPDEPYDNQILQVIYQLGLLQLKFPKAEIRGHIFNLCIGDGEYTDFGAYTPNSTVFASLVEKARHLMQCVETGEEAKPEPTLLCGLCHYKLGCPAFQSDKPPIPDDLIAAINEYDMLRAEIKAAEAKMKKIKGEVVDYVGVDYKNPVGEHVLKVSRVADSFTLDSKLFGEEYPALFNKYKKPKAGYIKMEVH